MNRKSAASAALKQRSTASHLALPPLGGRKKWTYRDGQRARHYKQQQQQHQQRGSGVILLSWDAADGRNAARWASLAIRNGGFNPSQEDGAQAQEAPFCSFGRHHVEEADFAVWSSEVGRFFCIYSTHTFVCGRLTVTQGRCAFDHALQHRPCSSTPTPQPLKLHPCSTAPTPYSPAPFSSTHYSPTPAAPPYSPAPCSPRRWGQLTSASLF